MPSTSLAFLLAASVSIGAHQQGRGVSPQAAPPDGVVIGRVVDAATGAPLAGAIVALIPTEAEDPRTVDSVSQRVLTSDEGEFVFGPIAASSYRIWVTIPGYRSAGYAQRPGGFPQPVAVAAHEIVDGLTIRLQKGAVVGGTVTDEYGEPVVGSLVNVIRRTWTAGRAQWELAGTPARDDRGVYRLPNLQPGEYSAYVPGMRVSYPAGFTPTAEVSGALMALMGYAPRLYPLDASGSLSSKSTTIGSTGSTIHERVGAFLTQTQQESRSIAPGATAKRGYPTTFAPGVPSPAEARVIAVAAGETAGNLDVQLRLVPAVAISGTIESASGPRAYVVVRLEPTSNGGNVFAAGFDAAMGVSDSRGAFVLYGVPAGQYVLRASQGVSSSSAPSESGSVAQPIVIEDADIANLALVLRPGIRVSGRVEFGGDPAKVPQDTSVMLRQAAGSMSIQSLVGADRHFTLSAEPGTYAVSSMLDFMIMAGLDSGWMIKSAMINGRDIATVPAEISADVTDLVVTFTDKPAGIAGTARTATGTADPLAVVLVFPADRSLWGTVTSEFRAFRDVSVDRNGAYSIKGLTAGEYFVIAMNETEVTQPGDPRFLEAAARVADRVTVREGQITTHDLKTTVVR